MCELFEKNQRTISHHILNVFREGELEEKSTTNFMSNAISDKPIRIYNLDVIISVGYRIKSRRGTQFRIWANKILKEYLIKGCSMNQQRLDYLEKSIKFEKTTKIRVKFK